MKWLIEKYNFSKFWECFTRHNNCVPKGHDRLSYMNVFLRRTLDNWFHGKCFHIEIADFTYSKDICQVHSKYIYIQSVRFLYNGYPVIVFTYTEPHSTKLQREEFNFTDFCFLRIQDAESEFKTIQKFYYTYEMEKSILIKQVNNI